MRGDMKLVFLRRNIPAGFSFFSPPKSGSDQMMDFADDRRHCQRKWTTSGGVAAFCPLLPLTPPARLLLPLGVRRQRSEGVAAFKESGWQIFPCAHPR